MSRTPRTSLRAAAGAVVVLAVLATTSACGSSTGAASGSRTASIADAGADTGATPDSATQPTDGWTGGWTGHHHGHHRSGASGWRSSAAVAGTEHAHSAGQALQQALAQQPGGAGAATVEGQDSGGAISTTTGTTTSTSTSTTSASSSSPSSTSPSTAAAMRSYAYRSSSARPTGSTGSTGSSSSSTSATSSAGSTATSTATSSATTSSTSSSTSASGSTVPTGTWLSGASGTGVADGSFGTWRGTPVAIAGTWADNNQAMVDLSQLHTGGEFGSWNKPIDVAIGAIGDGETWQAAASGAYDARWTQSLTNLKAAWGSRTGTVYIRFAHEMNGNWYPWAVNSGNADAFVASWKRFRALQQKIFPQSKLVFCVNRTSVGAGIDWRKTFPGAQYVDVLGVDSYNGWPTINSQADWDSSVNATASDGSPEGLGAYLAYAKSVGLPLAVSEWSGRASMGDSAFFIKAMHDFFAKNAGGGAGQLLYEIQFNCDMNGGDFMLHGAEAHMPNSAAEYVKDF